MEDESKHPEGEGKEEEEVKAEGEEGESKGEEPEPEAPAAEEGEGEAKDDAEAPAPPRAVGADVRSVITDIVKRVNETRAESGVEALALDARACEAADALCVDMLEYDYVGHWDARGWSQVQRYAVAGSDGTVHEVVDGADEFAEPLGLDADAIGRPVRKMVEAALEEGAEARKQLEADAGTHLAVGLATSAEKLRLCIAVIARGGELLVGGWPGRDLTLTGQVGRGVPAAITVRSQPMPEAPEAAELQSRTDLGTVEGDVILTLAAEELGVGEDPASFSCTAQLGALAPGAYTFTLHAAKDAEAAAAAAAALAEGAAPGDEVWEATRTVRTLTEDEAGAVAPEGSEEKEGDAGEAGATAAEEGKEGDGKEEEGKESEDATGPIVLFSVADDAAGLPEGASAVESQLVGEAVETDRDLLRCVGASKGTAELAIAEVRPVRYDASGKLDVPEGWELVDGGAVGRTEGAPSLILRRVDEERGEDERAVLRVVLRFGRPEEGEGGAVARADLGEEDEEEVELGVANASLVLCLGPASEAAAERAARREEEAREVARLEEEERLRREEEERQRQHERVEEMRRQVEEAERDRDATIAEHGELLQQVALSMQHSDSGIGGEGSAGAGAEAGTKQGPADGEKRYAELLRRCAEERSALQEKQEEYNDDAMELQARVDEKEAKANEIQESFVEFKREVAKASENSRTGKRIPPSIIKQFEITESKKEQELMRVRLRHLTLRAQLRKLEQALRKKEQLADGLHLIDFEQLKIENQTLQEKIEERNEELQKLRKKTTSTVQVLTHVKEKLQFVQGENQVLKQELAELDSKLSGQRDRLARSKQRRDRLRTDNDGLRQAQGFIYNRDLVFDFDDRQKEIEAMERKLDRLKNKHAILNQKVEAYQQHG